VAAKPRRGELQVVGVLGVGLDGDDGHRRLTEAGDVLLVGGSRETHERMQETAIRFNEELEKRGKTLRDADPHEVADLLRKARGD
jgi:hypothetical protein